MSARRTPSGADALAGPVTVRRASAADAAALAKFADRLFRATYGPAGDPSAGGGSRPDDVAAYADAHFALAQVAADLANPGLATFVAESLGELAGYAQLRLPTAGEQYAELARLYVDRLWQGRGAAGALLDAVTRTALAAGAGALRLFVYQRNGRAVAFYRRRGFAVTGSATFRMGAEVQDDWIMIRPLDGC